MAAEGSSSAQAAGERHGRMLGRSPPAEIRRFLKSSCSFDNVQQLQAFFDIYYGVCVQVFFVANVPHLNFHKLSAVFFAFKYFSKFKNCVLPMLLDNNRTGQLK